MTRNFTKNITYRDRRRSDREVMADCRHFCSRSLRVTKQGKEMEYPKLKMVYSKAEDVFEVKVFEVGDQYRICHFGPLGHETLLDMGSSYIKVRNTT